MNDCSVNDRLESCMIRSAAPTLAGLKCGCIFKIEMDADTLRKELSKINSMIKYKGIRSMILRSSENCNIVYTYRHDMLTKTLTENNVSSFLKRIGYTTNCIGAMLRNLRNRMTEGIVHEIGIFLGYPLNDVIGFMSNKGKNFLLTGCWKVYSDVGSAKAMFRDIHSCREKYYHALDQGQRLIDIIT